MHAEAPHLSSARCMCAYIPCGHAVHIDRYANMHHTLERALRAMETERREGERQTDDFRCNTFAVVHDHVSKR